MMTQFFALALTTALCCLPLGAHCASTPATQGETHKPVEVFQTEAQQAIMIDLTTGTVLLEKDADAKVPPSSMSKIMTVYLVLNEIKAGRLSFEDKFHISTKAWKMGGSRMFVQVDTQVSVGDLLRGVIVQSGNDAAVALAEGVSGSEEVFVEMMNATAKKMGCNDATFKNATGWPDPDHKMSMRDLAVIATRTMMDFPNFYKMYGEKEFVYNNIKQPNRNPLLDAGIGCDGLKTGHTDDGGYGLVASTVQKDRRLLIVINGCKSSKERAVESSRMLQYGYRAFSSTVLFSPGQVIDQADVWMGSKDKIPLVCDSHVAVTLPRALHKDVQAEIVYKTPLQAPVKKGDPVAKLVVKIPGKEDKEYPLVAGEDVGKMGFFSRIGSAFNYLVYGGAAS